MSTPLHHIPPGTRPFVFLHVGDLHLTTRNARNASDLRTILKEISGIRQGAFDFVYLPGDLAENGLASEYAILSDALKEQGGLPVRLIPGDHDRQYGTMDDFHAFHQTVMAPLHPPVVNALDQPPTDPAPCWPVRNIPQYYFREDFGPVRCLFLDMVSAGYGRKGIGLDFRLGRPQREWLAAEIAAARAERRTCAVYMHTYPHDLTEPEERAEVAGLFWSAGVRLVEIGHTHYNEIAHDGRTTYAAARSVGQNEDGSVGYAVGAIDGGAASWRFKPLDRTWPFVLVTSPVDRRVSTAGLRPDLLGRITVRALVLSDAPPRCCRCRVDDGPWQPMTDEGSGLHAARVPWPAGSRRVTVEAIGTGWPGHGPDWIDSDTVEPPGREFVRPDMPAEPGSDAVRIGPWLAKGVRGDQLGPNRNGRGW